MSESLSYVSLFSSAGLGCYGFKLRGFECIATAELLPRRLEVQRANEVCGQESGYILGDITQREVQARLMSRVESWREENSTEVTAILATPPCQGMSVANHKKGNELARNSLVVESLSLIEQIRPRYFVLENVRSFLNASCLDLDGVTKPIGTAIEANLAAHYNILSRVVNLKDYGSPSSRTRTLVLGVRRDIKDVTPADIFPSQSEAPLLQELIGSLPRLAEMSEISEVDIFHGFRAYDPRMRPWVAPLGEGESAFDNKDPILRPHRIIEGQIVPNKAANGDKYRKNRWDKVAPCVHTRNDILASQSTLHPEDDRVFSIRELSRMMGVDEQFRWAPFALNELNALPLSEKRTFLKEHEINIRQCLGEGVPTPVFESIAEKIAKYDCVLQGKNGRPRKSSKARELPFAAHYLREVELQNPRRKELAAYYTRQDTVFSLLSSLPELTGKKPVRILEPSVGAGAFLPLLIDKYASRGIEMDVVDIDPDALNRAKQLVDSLPLTDEVRTRVKVRYVESDFLEEFDAKTYDLVVGNPPFGARPTGQHLFKSALGVRDLFALFIEKSLRVAPVVAFVVPKSMLGGPEFRELRNHIRARRHIVAIDDYGEEAFSDIKIETIGMVLGRLEDFGQDAKAITTTVTSYPLKTRRTIQQAYLADPSMPSWLLYRNAFFEKVAEQLELGKFRSYRDRQLTKARQLSDGPVLVIKAKHIKRGSVQVESAEAIYCEESDVPTAYGRFLAGRDALVVPNLTYYPRAARLPNGAYADGSAAVLVRDTCEAGTERMDTDYYSSADFFYFYRIARNYSTRSLNIDAVSTFYWGIPKDGYTPVLGHEEFNPAPKNIFEAPTLEGQHTREDSPGAQAH